jgi:two-component system CheB/CheR fusion protein
MTTSPTRRTRVLIVEVERDAADSLRMLLELVGYEVDVAYDGAEGVRKALRWRPDVVLCDIGLPGLSGYGVAEQLRRDPATAESYLVAITAWGGEEDKQRGRQAGFEHHLVKPADPQRLLHLLASYSSS